jgi:hypothetical protein
MDTRMGRRAVLFSGALLLASALGACSSFAPVYGGHGVGAARPAFAYAKPANRLEQIIYQELIVSFGRSAGVGAPTVSVTATSTTRDLTRASSPRPADQREAIVTADIVVTDPAGAVVYSARRSASALYTTDGQGLADSEAARDARERAAGELAETIRLTLLGALSRPAG